MGNYPHLFFETNAPVRHSNFNPLESRSDVWSANYDELKKVIKEDSLVFLIGNRGTGKTQAACSALRYATEGLGKTGLYTKSLDIINSLLDATTTGTRTESTERYITPAVLVVDALEVRTDSDFESRQINHIIDKRYDHKKTTIIITNDSIEALEVFLGESTLDRANEAGMILVFDGDSFR